MFWYKLDENHKVVQVEDPHDPDYLAWMDDIGNRRVAADTVGDFWISTVFLPIDHDIPLINIEGHIPVVFETMVFQEGSSAEDLDMERYSTWEEAVEGHKRMVEKWKDKGGPNESL